ncbi:insulinase family protein [Planktotalea sp.]|uniref:M16 family metallopeptidase n=1 Tax=Planktotalea sp. TaxID=2029877 RepID=UPI003299FE4A
MLKVIAFAFALVLGTQAQAQEIISLNDIGGLHSAYVIPRDDLDRVDVQLIVLSGAYDDPYPSGTAHFTEHLAAFSADATVLRQPRTRDLFAKTTSVASVYTNSGTPDEFDRLMKLSRALLDPPNLPLDFMQSEIKIVQRETHLRERQYSTRWLTRRALQNLYQSKNGRANNAVEDLPKLNLEAALKFHQEHYVASNVTLLISGKIDPETAASMVTKYFGETEKTTPPAKPWLEAKPDPSHRSIEELTSDRLANNTLVYSKFIDLKDVETSVNMQGTFFIGSTIYMNRIDKALMYDVLDYGSVDMGSYFAKNGDLEVTMILVPLPHVTLEKALDTVENTIAQLLEAPLTQEEIEAARKQNMISAQNAARSVTSFLNFLENVAADGFPPITPGSYAQILEDTSDEEVKDFLNSFVAPAATSALLARKGD